MAGMAHWPLPLWIAHRGAGKLAPENTLAAFRLGAAHGYRAFECDVKLSADGVPFLLHDATLERTTNGQGTAGERPWAELSRLDAIAAYVQCNGFALNVEIKPTPGLEHATGVAVGAACARLWSAGAAPLLFSSFRPEALAGARETAPAVPRAQLLDSLWPGWLDVTLSLGCMAVVCNHKLVDAALVAQLRAAGLRLACYTVNEAADARRLLALGVDGLITDAVDRFAPSVEVVAD